jgi:hypothetical protein
VMVVSLAESDDRLVCRASAWHFSRPPLQ